MSPLIALVKSSSASRPPVLVIAAGFVGRVQAAGSVVLPFAMRFSIARTLSACKSMRILSAALSAREGRDVGKHRVEHALSKGEGNVDDGRLARRGEARSEDAAEDRARVVLGRDRQVRSGVRKVLQRRAFVAVQGLRNADRSDLNFESLR